MDFSSLLLFVFAAICPQIDARPSHPNKISNSTQRSYFSGSLIEQRIREKTNLDKWPRPIPHRVVIKWFVRETMEKINRKDTRFGEKVDTIRFSNALGYSKEDTTYKLVYTFDLSGIQDRYKEIFGHDLYFRAPAKILKDHGSPAYFHVSVWEAGRLLNSSVLAPVSGHDYKIVIDKLSRIEYATQNKIDLIVDMGCEVHGIDQQSDRSNASIATYGYMPPKRLLFQHQHFLRSKRNRLRERRDVGENSCCTLHPYKQFLGHRDLGHQDRVIAPLFVMDNFCRVKQGFRKQFQTCKTVSQREETSVLVLNSLTGQMAVRPISRNVGKWCFCE